MQQLHQIYPRNTKELQLYHIKFHAVRHDEHQLDNMTFDPPNL